MLNCEQVKAALSARLDGEASGLDDDVVDAHVAVCPSCRDYLEQAAAINRTLALGAAPVANDGSPDLSEAILSGVESEFQRTAARRAASTAFARVAMVVVACCWIAWAIVVLTRPTSNPTGAADPYETQLLIEAVSMRCALAFGLIFAAWQPRFMIGLLPVVGGLWMFTFGMSVRDVLTGSISSGMVLQLVLLLATLVSMGWTWLADKGWAMVRNALGSLSSSPRSER